MKKQLSILAVATLAAASSAFAANITWDITSGNGVIDDGAGNWDATTANWTTNGGTADFAWNNTTNAADTAVFGGSQSGTNALAGGAVAIAAGGITAGGLSFTGNTYASPYVLSGGILTFSQPTAAITLSSASFGPAATISSVIAGAAAVTLTGTSYNNYSYLTLSGANTYSGGTTLNTAISVTANNNAAFGTGAITVAGYYTSISGTATTTNNLILQNDLGTSGTLSFASVDLQGQTRTLTVSGSTRLTGVISNGSLTKSGSGDLTLGGANTFSGGLTLKAGTLRVLGSNTALGTGTLTATTATANATSTVTLATQSGSTAVTFANNVAITNNGTGVTTLAVDGGYAAITLNGVISGNGKFATASSGNVTLGGVNTYTGATTVGGSNTLTVANTGAVRINGAAGITVGSGTTLVVNGKLTATSVSDTIANSGTITLGGASVLDLGSLFNSQTAGSTYQLITGGTTTGNFGSIIGYASGSVTFNNATGVLTFTAVPEPSAYGLLGAGALAGVAFTRRRKKSA